MSEPTTIESPHVSPVRPLSSISLLTHRLNCSRLHDDLPMDTAVAVVAEPRTRLRRTHRPKAVNFTNEEVCWINEASGISRGQRSPSSTSDVDGASPATCDSGNEDSSEAWTGTSSASSSRAPEIIPASSSFSLAIESDQFQSAQHQCLSTSAPDGQALANFTLGDARNLAPMAWADHDDRKVFCFTPKQQQQQQQPATASSGLPELDGTTNPPAKRACRSQSVSHCHNSTKQSSCRRASIVRPIAVRLLPQRPLYSPATNSSALSTTAHALVTSGCVKLRNGGHQMRVPTSRLSWHHPIAYTNNLIAGAGRTRFVPPAGSGFPLLNSSSRHSVVFGDTTTPEMNIPADVRLRKPPSLACLSASASNATDFSHHRLSAFTPTTQSRLVSPMGAAHIPPFSPDAISSPCGHPPSLLLHPSVSAASSGFFQDSCSSFCCVERANVQIPDGKSHSDDSTDSSSSSTSYSGGSTSSCYEHKQNCAAKMRCQSQPAELAGLPIGSCCAVASTECLSRQPGAAGNKRRRCNPHEVDCGGGCNAAHSAGDWEDSAPPSSANTATGFLFPPAFDVLDMTDVSSASFHQPDLGFLPSDSLLACRREELSGLSEASEEEESNDQLQQHHQRACCNSGTPPPEEYDAGTLTPPPPQTRFRPIAPSPEPDDQNHDHFNSISTEDSLCSFKAIDNATMPSDDDDEDVDADVEDAFGGIAPGLGHRRLRLSPMQIGGDAQVSVAAGKWGGLDIGMIEQDD